MKKITLKKLSLIFAALLLLILVIGKVADSSCYTGYPGGNAKITYLHQQIIYGFDCFTGKFDPPVKIAYPADEQSNYGFDFDRFRFMYMGLIGLLIFHVSFLFLNKKIPATLFATLAFLAGIVCAIYLDAYHNYYWEAGDVRFPDTSKTFDINLGWLQHIGFWLLFTIILFLQWAPLITYFSDKRNNRRRSEEQLLDN